MAKEYYSVSPPMDLTLKEIQETFNELNIRLLSISHRLNLIDLNDQSTDWTMTNVTEDKVLDADSTSTAELADVLGTLIDTLKDYSILGS